MVVDLSTRRAKLVVAGGESGAPEAATFSDQLDLWRQGGSLELELGEVREGETVELIPG
jgi:hypothetical protein